MISNLVSKRKSIWNYSSVLCRCLWPFISQPTSDLPLCLQWIFLCKLTALLTFGPSFSVVIVEVCHLNPLQENMLQGPVWMVGCPPSECHACIKSETSLWCCFLNRMDRWAQEIRGESSSGSIYLHSQPLGGFALFVPGTLGTSGWVFIPSGGTVLSRDGARIPINDRYCSQSCLDALHPGTSR